MMPVGEVLPSKETTGLAVNVTVEVDVLDVLVIGSTETVGVETVWPCVLPPTVTPTAVLINPVESTTSTGFGADSTAISPLHSIFRLAARLPSFEPSNRPMSEYSLEIRW